MQHALRRWPIQDKHMFCGSPWGRTRGCMQRTHLLGWKTEAPGRLAGWLHGLQTPAWPAGPCCPCLPLPLAQPPVHAIVVRCMPHLLWSTGRRFLAALLADAFLLLGKTCKGLGHLHHCLLKLGVCTPGMASSLWHQGGAGWRLPSARPPQCSSVLCGLQRAVGCCHPLHAAGSAEDYLLP